MLPGVPEVVQRQFADAVLAMWEASSKAAGESSLATETQCAHRLHALTTQLTHERKLREQLELDACSTRAALSACKQREHFATEEALMLREELGIEKALRRRAESESDKMLKQLGALCTKASRCDDSHTAPPRLAMRTVKRPPTNASRGVTG